jgi:large subunit ribosomal protein L21
MFFLMTQAIVDLNGKQYEVVQGRYVDVDLLALEPGATLTLDKVQVLIEEGKAPQVGMPFLAGAKVEAKVLEHGRGRKVTVFKMRSKKGYRRKYGHRAGYTRLQIESISA